MQSPRVRVPSPVLCAILALSVGCARKLPSDGPHCEEHASVVALDAPTALGFTVAELLALAEGQRTETLTWERDGSTTGLELGVSWTAGEARFVESVPVYPDGEQPAIGLICEHRVEVDVEVVFHTADGAFDEAWTGPLQGREATLARLTHPLDPDDLDGTYVMDVDIDVPEYDTRNLWVDGTFDAAGSVGAVVGQVSGEEECSAGDTCTAWAMEVSVGHWE